MSALVLASGSDGGHTRTIEFSRHPRFRPLRHAQSVERQLALRGAVPSLSPADWPAIVARAVSEGLRPIATSYGVSPETIRAILRRAGRADVLADADRRQILAAAAPLPPPTPAKIPAARHAEVRALRRRHTQAEVAALFGVSQATIWRIARRATEPEGTATAGKIGT